MRRPCKHDPRWLVTAALVLVALVFRPVTAFGQTARASFFLQMLRQNPDARVRLSAALRLGELREAETVEPMIQAFDQERDPTVQAAVLSAFSSIGDPRALPVVQAAIRNPNASVAAQARRALPVLQAAARNVATPGPATPVPTGGSARFLVGVGSVTTQPGVSSDLAGAAQEQLRTTLGQNGSVMLHTGNAAAAQRLMRGRPLRGHFFDPVIQSVQPRGNGVRVSVSIAVSTYPGRVFEFDSQSTITITGGSGAGTATQADAVRRATESATNRAVNQLSAQ